MSKRLVLACVVAAGHFAQTAFAADPGWYLGASFGSVSSDASGASLVEAQDSALFISGLFADTTGVSSVDDTSNTWSVLAGYHVSQNLSVEVAYVDLGEISYGYRGELGFGGLPGPSPIPAPTLVPGTSQIEWDNSALSVKLVGRLPFKDRFDVHAQIGGAMVRTDITSSTSMATNPADEFAVEQDTDSLGLVYGVGAAVRFGSRWSLSADWQRYEVSEADDTPLDLNATYDAVTLALTFALDAH